MVKVICEKTGIEFETATRRTKNHPQIMGWLSEASKEGWYGLAMEAIKQGRQQNLATIDGFLALLQDAHDKHFGKGKYDYRTYSETYKSRIDAAIQAYMATYDPNQPIEEDFKLESSPTNLLSRRLIRYCIMPIQDEANMPAEIALRMRSECLEPVIKPMRDAREAQQKEEKRRFLASLKDRPVVKEESYTRGAPYSGDYSYFLPEQTILICSYSHFDQAPTDYLQEEDSTFCRFVEPSEEEKQSDEYRQCLKWMQDALRKEEKEKERQARQEARRQAELDAIRASGREPDLFDDIFAGTSDN